MRTHDEEESRMEAYRLRKFYRRLPYVENSPLLSCSKTSEVSEGVLEEAFLDCMGSSIILAPMVLQIHNGEEGGLCRYFRWL